MPDLIKAAADCERFGAQGITVHPRPDERHIRYRDVYELKKLVTTEFNIEGNPTEKFLKLINDIKPQQVTLVPDAPDAITSNAGWDTKKEKDFLKKIIAEIKSIGSRVSIFIDADKEMISHAAETGTDRIELYTENYARNFSADKVRALQPFKAAAAHATSVGLGVNAGHDLNLDNLHYFSSNIPELLEVSIGHALISDALYFGLENTIQLYLRQLK